MSDTNTPKSGLIRMLVCDTSLLAGRLDEVPFDGHTSLIGGNGIGKSSLLDLTPIFLGENLSAVVKSSKGKSFIEHNLPRNTSKIAFEYFNHKGDLCSVILTPDPQGNTVRYRFIKGGLTKAMFVITDEDGDERFVENETLTAHLTRLGRSFSAKMIDTTKAYRAIIQGSKPESEDGKDVRANAAFISQMNYEYGLSPKSAPLTGLDRLLTQMLRNQVNIKQMLGVIARLATDSDISHVDILPSGSAKDSARWPERYRAYQTVMAQETVARELGALALEYDVLQEDIEDYLMALSFIKHQATESKETAEIVLASLKETRSANAKQRDEEEEAARILVTQAKQALQITQSNIAQYRADTERLTERGAPQAQAMVDQIPTLREAVSLAENHHQILTQKGDGITRKMEKLASEANATAGQQREDIRKKTDDDRAKLEEQRSTHDTSHDDDLAKLRANTVTKLSEHDIRINAARDAHHALLVAQANIQPDDAFAKRLETAERKEEAAQKALADENATRDLAQKAFDDAHAAWTAAEIGLSQAKAQADAAEARIAKTEAEISPKDGSFLSWLRKHAPEHVETIGKLVPQSILNDTKLSPSIVNNDKTFFGIQIETDHIELPDYLDISVLNERLSAARADWDKAKTAISKAQDDLKRTSKMRSSARKELDDAQAAASVASSKSGTAKMELSNIQVEVSDHLKAKKAVMDKEIATASEALTAAHSAKSEADKAAKGQELELIGKAKTRRAEIDRKLSALGSDLAAMLKDIDAKLKAGLERIDADRLQALSDTGIDEAALKAAEQAIADAKGKLCEAQGKRDLADLWSRHKAREEEYMAQAAAEPNLIAGLREAEAKASRVTEKWQETAKDLTRQQNKAEADQEAAVKILTDIATRAGTMVDEINPARNEHVEMGAGAVLIGLLDKQAHSNTLRMNGGKLARKINAVFNSCKDQSITAYLDHLGDKRGEPGLGWADHMLKWYNEEHLATRDILMNGMSSSIAPIIQAYHALVEVNTSVSTLGRKMAKAIRQNTNFHHVTDVDLTMRSDICSGDLWAKLSALHDEHKAWQNSGAGAAPSEDLVEAIDDLLKYCEATGQTRVMIADSIFLDGSLREGGNLKVLNRSTDLADLSSTGNVLVIRLILFTALLTIMRKGRDIGVVWAVDEIAAMDHTNLRSLLTMLDANGIKLFTAAPDLTQQKQAQFPNRIRIEKGYLLNFQDGSRNGMREWVDDTTLTWPELIEDSLGYTTQPTSDDREMA
jgi:hypothetical protein